MPPLYSFIKYTIFLFFLLLVQQAQGQSKQDLETEIEQHEQAIDNLERQKASNNSNGNSSANTALQREIEDHERQIQVLVARIKQLDQQQPAGDCELEIVAARKETAAVQAIVDDLEQENLELNKEIQRLVMENGGSAEIEKLRNKVAVQKEEIKVLKSQVKGYQQRMVKASSNTPSTASAQRQVNQQPNRSKTIHDFQRQFVNENATNFLIGYRYKTLPQLNFLETPLIYQGLGPSVGTLVSKPTERMTGHDAYLGIERLIHRSSIGFNIGLSGRYAYMAQPDFYYQTVGGQLGVEITVLPIRLGIRASANFGYLWGRFKGHNMRREDRSIVSNPSFGSLHAGWEGKLRAYISRRVAITGSIGSDRPISLEEDSDNAAANTWGTSLQIGIGVDVLLQLSK